MARSSGIAALVLAIAIAFAITSCNKMRSYKRPPLNKSGDISVDTKSLREKVPEFYTYTIDGQKINFFLIKVNGEVQSYFDACAMCYPQKMGFRVEGDEIVCRACNVRYTADELKVGKGSCHPIPLAGRTKNGFYIITKDNIRAGLKYF